MIRLQSAKLLIAPPLPTRRRKDSDNKNDWENGLRMKKEKEMNDKRFSFFVILQAWK